MIKPSVIVCWPTHVDYPLFRYNLERFKSYFDTVFIAITQRTIPDPYYMEFVRQQLPWVRFESVSSDGDWRSIQIKDIVDNFVTSSYVLFLEQDFLIRDKRFFEVILNQFEHPVVYYEEGERIHPACALVPLDVIRKTSRDFSARPPAYDHFGLFFREVLRMTHGTDLESLGLHSGEDYYHMAGFTNNYHCIREGQPLYKPDEFVAYNRYVQTLPVAQHPVFLERCKAIEERYGKGDGNSFIKEFFPKGVV